MPSSIPHQKFCFYHLPTWRRAGIKLGDAWYVSNVSIIFDCSMLLYYPFWCVMGFTIYFYIIFGTNLLTGGPAQIAVFLPISVFCRKIISNGVQTEWNLQDVIFRTNVIQRTWSLRKAINEEGTRQGARLPPGRAALPRGRLVAFVTSTPSLLDCICSKKIAPKGFIPFGLRLIFLFFETPK